MTTQSQGPINPLVRWLSVETASTDRYKKQKTAFFFCYQRRDVSSATIALLKSSCWGLYTADFILVFTRGKPFHKKLYECRSGLDQLGFASCRHLFKSALASGYCTLIKKAELMSCWMHYVMESIKAACCLYLCLQTVPWKMWHYKSGIYLELMYVSGLKWSEIPHLWASNRIFWFAVYETHCIVTFHWKIQISTEFYGSPENT